MRRFLVLTGVLAMAASPAMAQSTANPMGRDGLQQFGVAVAVLPNQVFVGEPISAATPGGRVHI
jgi:hypothetical protein